MSVPNVLPKKNAVEKARTPIRIRIGNVRREAEQLLPYCDEPSRVRVADILRGDIANPNLDLLKAVTVFPVPRLTAKDDLIKQIRSEGHVPAHPDVLFRLLNALSGSDMNRATLRRSFLADVHTILCLETTFVPGRGQVNVVCGQVSCERVDGQRPFSFDYTDGIQRVPGGIYSVLVMKNAK